MASFQKRGKTWQYTVSAKPKAIRKGGFKTKKEAKIAATELEAKLSKGITPHMSTDPFDEYFESWINVYKRNIGINTRARYEDTLETIKNHFMGKTIQKITKRSYQEFLNIYGQTHAKATSRKLNSHIRACVKDAIDEGIIHQDFTRGAVLTGNNHEKRPEEKHLNYFDSKKLLHTLMDRLDKSLTHYLLLLGLTTGLRFGEMVGLTREDFDFKKDTIRVNKTWGYTVKMHEGFGPTKNDQSVRTIKVSKVIMNTFKELFENTPENIYKLVFFSPRSKYRVISNGAANKVLINLLEELNIEPISVHGLRHTHASVLLYKGVSVYYVSERLGHKDIETTHQHYAHIVKELRQKDEKQTTKVFEDMAG